MGYGYVLCVGEEEDARRAFRRVRPAVRRRGVRGFAVGINAAGGGAHVAVCDSFGVY